MAFKGDFGNLDIELKSQLKAIIDNDLVVMKKIQNQEWTQNDMNFYL